ncbi:MAG: asparaginase [Syntrophaceae bacterium]|nr:asparaginase [Syntrophaceae bacterium]
MKKKILYIKAGGTIGMKPSTKGYDYSAKSKQSEKYDYLKEMEGLENIADITSMELFEIDSTDIGISERKLLAECIYSNYDRYDGFVIGHGTDTMVDSAAAIKYMLPGASKPIIFTGAQIPIYGRIETDGKRNVYNAVKLATKDLGEVVISFGSKILQADKAIKFSEEDMDAFQSYKAPQIGENGLEIKLTGSYHKRDEKTSESIDLFTDFDDNIGVYTQVSGGKNSLEGFEKYSGVIIQGFGAGGINKDLVEGIRYLTRKNIPIIITTTCVKGAAEMDIYAVGNRAKDAGAISAGDMTLYAVQQKLMCLLGKFKKLGFPLEERIRYVKEAFYGPNIKK